MSAQQNDPSTLLASLENLQLSDEDLQVVTRYQDFVTQFDVMFLTQIQILKGDAEMFALTLAGMDTGSEQAKAYFRAFRDFLNRPEVSEALT